MCLLSFFFFFSLKLLNFPTFSFFCLTLSAFLLYYSNLSWNVIHLYFSMHLQSPYFNCKLYASSVVIHCLSTCCCTLNYTRYSFMLLLPYVYMPLWFWYCTVNYIVVLLYTTPSLHLYTCTILVLYCELYVCTVLRHSFSTPLCLYTSTSVRHSFTVLFSVHFFGYMFLTLLCLY